MENKKQLFFIGYAVAALAVILIGIFALKIAVVPVCAFLVLETGLAVMMHKAEIWAHGIVIIIQFITGIVTQNTALVILCIVMYFLAIYILKINSQEKN